MDFFWLGFFSVNEIQFWLHFPLCCTRTMTFRPLIIDFGNIRNNNSWFYRSIHRSWLSFSGNERTSRDKFYSAVYFRLTKLVCWQSRDLLIVGRCMHFRDIFRSRREQVAWKNMDIGPVDGRMAGGTWKRSWKINIRWQLWRGWTGGEIDDVYSCDNPAGHGIFNYAEWFP